MLLWGQNWPQEPLPRLNSKLYSPGVQNLMQSEFSGWTFERVVYSEARGLRHVFEAFHILLVNLSVSIKPGQPTNSGSLKFTKGFLQTEAFLLFLSSLKLQHRNLTLKIRDSQAFIQFCSININCVDYTIIHYTYSQLIRGMADWQMSSKKLWWEKKFGKILQKFWNVISSLLIEL